MSDLNWDALNVLQPLAQLATHRIAFFRDTTDSFQVVVEPTSPRARDVVELTKQDVMQVLPKGSRWQHVLGWRSLMGQWITAAEGKLLLLGVVTVERHPLRGAFPTMYGFVGCNPGPELCRALNGTARRISPTPVKNMPSYGVFWCDSEDLDDHSHVEAAVLHSAAERYTQPTSFEFRSMVLSEDDVPPLTKSRSSLIVTSSKTQDGFGAWTKRRLRMMKGL